MFRALLSSFTLVLVVGCSTEAPPDVSADDSLEVALTGELVGQVCNRHVGEFLVEGSVTLMLPSGEQLATELDENGAFALRDLPLGEHVVFVEGPAYSRTALVEIRAGEATVLEGSTDECSRSSQAP